jgi:hypothetical protein
MLMGRLRLNAEKMMYECMSLHQNAGQNRNVKLINKSFENVGGSVTVTN